MNFSPRKVQGLPIFQDGSGYWARPILKGGQRAWRKLDAAEVTDAVVEWKQKSGQHEDFLKGTAATSPWEVSLQTLEGLAKLYLTEQCPDQRGEKHNAEYCSWVEYRLPPILEFFGKWHPNDIRLRHIQEDYYKWRIKQFKAGKGARMIELEWATLSSIQKFGIGKGVVELAWISQNRPRLRRDNPGRSLAAPIRHARDVAPRSGDEVHAVAESLMRHPESQPTAWFWLFACLTGLRRAELLQLRVDATDKKMPGFSDDRFLYVRRGKRSRCHEVLLYPELEELMSEHFVWHQEYAPKNPYYFPGQTKGALHESSASHVLARTCARLGLPHFTPHGARAFFATVLRSQRLNDTDVAGRIGDQTVALIATTYGGSTYHMSKPLSFRPKSGLPVWKRWREQAAVQPRPMEVK